jgi:hypothetical protein
MGFSAPTRLGRELTTTEDIRNDPVSTRRALLTVHSSMVGDADTDDQ